MAYGPKNQEDFFLLLLMGGMLKNPDHEALLLLTTTTSTVMVIPVARPITVSASEVSWRRSISLPVERVRAETSPAPPIGAPSRSFWWRRVLTATSIIRLRRLTVAPSTSTLITQSFGFGLLLVGRMLPLLCPGFHVTFRFRFAGLRIRDKHLNDTLLTESVAGILPEDLLHCLCYRSLV